MHRYGMNSMVDNEYPWHRPGRAPRFKVTTATACMTAGRLGVRAEVCVRQQVQMMYRHY